MKDIMIDLETLGTKSHAPVLSIGAVVFDVDTGELGAQFYMNVALQPQLDAGRKVDADTFYWWMTQSKAAQEALCSKNAQSPGHVLFELSRFVMNAGSIKTTNVWGNGSSFDISILESLCETFSVPVPWRYSRIMDFRTFKRFVGRPGSDYVNKGTAHNALDDAIAQAQYVIDECKARRAE